MSTAVLTKLSMSEGPNDDWKATLPMWVMEILDNEPGIFLGWRQHFLHVNVFTGYVELWLDESFTKYRFPFRSFIIDRQDADKIYRSRKH